MNPYPQALPVRFARIVGTAARPQTMWQDDQPCERGTLHVATGPEVYRSAVRFDEAVPGEADLPAEAWAGLCCGTCGAAAPEDAQRFVISLHVWDTPSGQLEPGCLYRQEWTEDIDSPHFKNPDGSLHVFAVLPCGCRWNIDSQASNCTRPGDRAHKCWIRHGDPEDPQGERTGRKFHVDKQGETCAAGAGSIVCGGGHYHGFLHGGVFTPGL